jgi:histidinol-phosphate aminotransferase
MSRFWNPIVARLSPYVPGEQPSRGDLVKLNTNELPFGPSPAALRAIREAADDSLRLYPDPTSRGLRTALAASHGVGLSQVFVGNGSDEVLAHAFRALFKDDAPVLFPDISYSFYPVFAAFFALEYQALPLNKNLEIDLADYRRANGGIIFANPNAPTGICLPREGIEALLQDNRDTVVVVDEAYVDFGGDSAVALIDQYPNLLVVQTLSKSRALAGLRVGAAFGQEDLIEGLVRVKDSFNSYPLDCLAEVGAIAALEDEAWFERCRHEVMDNRESLRGKLTDLGFDVLPSAANFLFVTHPRQSAVALLQGLREQGILVRHFDKPRIESYLRITIGDREQCDRVAQALESLLNQKAGDDR